MSDLRAQNLAICAVLYGLKATSTRFDVPAATLSEAVAELLEDATHPFFAGIRSELKIKAEKVGVQKTSEQFHLPLMLAEMLAMEKDTDDRSTHYTGSPVDSVKSGKFVETPKKEIEETPKKRREKTPKKVSEDTPVDKGLDDLEFSTVRKRSHKARLARAVELYKQGISAELLSDKLNIANKYKIHQCGNWSQLPLTTVTELGKIQYSVTQMCGKKGYTLKQIEKVFQDQPKGLLKVMYDSAVARESSKKRKVAEEQ